MKVGILGSGEVGQALGRGFASRGHDVKIASRNPKSETLAMWQKQTKGKASTGTFEETAKHGEILVLASLGRAVEKVVGILKEFGWPGAIDVGGIEGARWLEATVPLWVLIGQRLGRWDHAFRVVHG